MRRFLRVLLAAFALTATVTGAAHAQATGGIFGKATDSSDGVLPGVTVTVTGPALQAPLVQVTQNSGAYQFPVVPVGTFTITFELSGFKKASRAGIVITSGFNAPIDMKMEVGAMTEEVTVTAAPPVVDTKKTTSGATFTAEILEKIPTARDPWQIINMTPGVQAGLNVGGSSSGQQVGLASRGTASNVQWNLEGGSITDLSSNSSPAYFNFDSFDQISVTNGGGDVSVQSSGLSINLVTKSGSNVFKGSAVGTFQNANMQANNVTEQQFARGSGGFLSGAPIKKIYNISGEYGGPIIKNRLWWWAAADKQHINAGVVNFFDRSRSGCVPYADAQRAGTLLSGGSLNFNNLREVQDCLSPDTTIIKNMQAKVNFQLNASHKFQYQFSSDNKFRNARDASANTEKEATSVQTSETYWKYFPLPMHQLSHTFIVNDRLVFNTALTKVFGGFFLDYQDSQGACGGSRWTNSIERSSYPQAGKPECMFNTQQQLIRTTGNLSRSKFSPYQTVRPSLDIKTDGTYFLTNVLGGDHSLKFGVGYRRNPITSFTHPSGGGRAQVQCVNNLLANCGDGKTYVPVGSTGPGLVPYVAQLARDFVLNNDWWSYNGYIQDSYSYKRLRVNAGLRYDWQQSKWLGGCVTANEIIPDLLPGYCEGELTGGVSPLTGQTEELKPFSTWSPRMSLTYDLFGDGKTALKGTGSYYYQTKITLANSLSGLGNFFVNYGPNLASGACSTVAGASCWNDANRDGFIQRNELLGTPTLPSNFVDGRIVAAGNRVADDAKLSRTREITLGLSHELINNLAVGADFIYRKYDHGTTGYIIGTEPGAAGFPQSSVYSTTPSVYVDPVTGKSANYYVVQQGLARPSGATITTTNLAYENYTGVDLTLNKRYSNKWQLNIALTLQKREDFSPLGSYGNPTGIEYDNGRNTTRGGNNGARYLLKVNGSYDLPWGIMASTNFNMNDGSIRNMVINGPGQVYGGTTGAISYGTLAFEPSGTTRLERTMLWDVGLNKTFSFRGGQNRVKLTVDGFNILNSAPVLQFSSNNLSLVGTAANPVLPSERINSILPPRVFRAGMTFWF